MGIYEFFATNYLVGTEATSSPSDSRATGNSSSSSSSAPSAKSTSDSSGSDSSSNRNSSHAFRKPFADSEKNNNSISTSSGSSGQAPSRSSGSSSAESGLPELPTRNYDNGENSTTAGEASLQTTDTYGFAANPSSPEVLKPTARALTEKMYNSGKSSSSGSGTPQHDNADRRGSKSPSSSSEESEYQGSTSRIQPGKTNKKDGGKEDEESSGSSGESSESDDSSVPAGPIPLETSFEEGIMSGKSFSSVSSSSSEESRSSEESSSRDDSRQSSQDYREKSSNSGGDSTEKKRHSGSEGSSDEMESDDNLLRSAKSFGSTGDRDKDTNDSNSSKTSRSSSSSSQTSERKKSPKTKNEKRGHGSRRSSNSSNSRSSTSNKEDAYYPKPMQDFSSSSSSNSRRKKLELKGNSSSSDSDRRAKEKPKQWSDFLPSQHATAPSPHDSDEFRWVPSDKNGWNPPVIRLVPAVPASDAHIRAVETQPLISQARHEFLPQGMIYKPDPPFEGSNQNVLGSMETPPNYANFIASGARRHIENIAGNMPPVPPMDRKMRQKDYHGIPPIAEISVVPGYDDESTLGTEVFHYGPLMMGGHGRPGQHSSPNVRQISPWPVRMSEVLRNGKEGEDPPEGKTDRASSYLQFINPVAPPAPPAKPQASRLKEKSHPSQAINVGFSRRADGSENSWVPTQLKSQLKSAGPIRLSSPKEEPTLQDPNNLLHSQTIKSPSAKSNSENSTWNPNRIQISDPSAAKGAAVDTMETPTDSFAAEPLVSNVSMDEETEEEVIIEEDASSSASSSMMEVTVASGQSDQQSRPANQRSEPEEEDSSSSSQYVPGILDSSSSSSSFSPRHSRPNVPTNKSKPPIVTPFQRHQPNNSTDLEDQRQPFSGSQKPQRQTALRNAVIALVTLLLIIVTGVVVFFLMNEGDPSPAAAAVNPPTTRPTTAPPTPMPSLSQLPSLSQSPSLSPTLASRSPSSPTPRPTRRPAPSPTRPPGDPDILGDAYYQMIVSAYPKGGDAIQNRSSPQRSAFEWLRSVSNVQNLPEDRVLQRYALATLFYSTRGWEWSKASRWLSNEHECSWFSTSTAIDVCNPNRELVVLSLRENNLDGTIPAETFALLPLIEEVQLHGNDLEGSIPTEVSNLSSLALFDLSSNQMFSNIPSHFGRLTNLKRIALANNKIFSTIPTELGRLSSLETLDLGANQLTGTIPTSMSRMTSLAGLSLYANYISGTVPRAFSSLLNLELIYIDGNYLSGSVSNSLCQLQVREFWADCDRVTCSCCTTCCTAKGCGN